MAKRKDFVCWFPGSETECPHYRGPQMCKPSNHHVFWPKTWYQTPLERAFYCLRVNRYRVCRAYHDYIHKYPPPPKPSGKTMLRAVLSEKGQKFLEKILKTSKRCGSSEKRQEKPS